MNPLREKLETTAAKALVTAFRVLPETWSLALGRALGTLACRLDGKHRRIALDNLEKAIPEMGQAARERTVRAMYQGFGLTLAEWAQAQGWSHDEMLGRVEYEGLEHAQAALEAGKGAVILVGHLGNWELTGAVFAAKFPGRVLVAAQEQNNRSFDRYINGLRESRGMEVVLSKQGAAGVLVDGLRANKFLGILSDQHAGPGGEILPFFGRPCSVLRSPVILARRSGAALLAAVLRRDGGGKFRFTLKPAPNPREGSVGKATELWLKVFEGIVREKPEDWFWVHRRWKADGSR